MKKFNSILALIFVALCLTGCGSLIPQRVEFFQDKVKALPTITEKAEEHQRQAAQFIAKKVEETKTAALNTHADARVIAPTFEAGQVANALMESLGPPLDPYFSWDATNIAPALAQTLNHDQAELNKSVRAFGKAEAKDVGKKIEGTGLFSVSYFTYIGGIIVLVMIGWGVLKLYGAANPAVGLGVNTVSGIASSVISKGFSELVAGGEAFKNYVVASPLTTEAKDYVMSLFTQAHTSNQSQDIQKLVDTLTNNPAAITTPPIAPPPAAPSPAPAPVVPVTPAPAPLAVLPAVNDTILAPEAVPPVAAQVYFNPGR